MKRLRILLRKLRAKLTGRVPCSFETKHGHDLHFTRFYGKGIGTHAAYQCSVCKRRWWFNSIFGWEEM